MTNSMDRNTLSERMKSIFSMGNIDCPSIPEKAHLGAVSSSLDIIESFLKLHERARAIGLPNLAEYADHEAAGEIVMLLAYFMALEKGVEFGQAMNIKATN